MNSPAAPALPSRSKYALGVMFALTALNVLDRQVLATLIEPIKRDLQVSDTAMGLLSGTAFTLFHVASVLPVSRWADRGNRRNIIVLGLFAWSALTAATGLARSYAHIFIARMGVGIGETVGSGPVQSLLSDSFPPERRAAAFSILGSGGVIGSMLGFAMGGWLAQEFGWRMTFVLFGIPGVLLSALIWFTVREPTRGAFDGLEETQDESIGACIRYLVALPSFRHVALAGSLNAAGNYSLLTWAQPFLMRTYDLPIAEAGFTLAIALSCSTTVGLWTSGFLGDRLGRRDKRWYCFVPAIASLLAVPMAIGFLLAPSLPVAIGFLVPAAFLNTMWLGNGSAVVQSLAKPRMRAVATALNVLANSGVGYGLGPVVVGALSDRLAPTYGVESLRYALLLAMLPHAWAALHSFLASRSYRRDLLAKENS